MALLLTRSDVIDVLDMKSAMDIVEKAFAELFYGSALMPQRTPIEVGDQDCVALFMPAYLKQLGAIGAKIVTVFKQNMPKHNLPAVLGTVVVLDEKTGRTEAIMDGGFLTAICTGAVSGVATKYMVNPEAKVASIIGSGIQARTQIWATVEAHAFTKYYVYSIDPPDQIDAFCQEMSHMHGIPFERTETAREAVEMADVLTLASSAKEPIIDGAWLRPGCHINGIGSHVPAMRELDTKTVNKARIICDLKSACLAEAGDFIIPINESQFDESRIAGNLGDVVVGKVPARTSPDEITLFKSVGLAIQDVSTAMAVLRRARELGVGTEFDFNS
ncbi:MAG: ornithine cyclodeaminase family protein [Candidatus Kapaibacterium sp.]